MSHTDIAVHDPEPQVLEQDQRDTRIAEVEAELARVTSPAR
jgi:hypothetical protein